MKKHYKDVSILLDDGNRLSGVVQCDGDGVTVFNKFGFIFLFEEKRSKEISSNHIVMIETLYED